MKNEELTEEQRLVIIAEVVRSVKAGETIVEVDQDMIDEYKAEQATEDFVVEHGLLDVKDEDIEDEKQFFELEEKVDFDADESETDMNSLSPSLRETFESNL
jgi:acetolactate synthase small subunit|tara:strand:- start:2103 stop:2408 length:306 start_codon:yes stop_codon:yes gene_type:complete